MLLSETCLLASQDLSSDKRICFDGNNSIETIAQSDTNSEEGNASISDVQHKCLSHYSKKDNMLNEDALSVYSSSHSSIYYYSCNDDNCKDTDNNFAMQPCDNDDSSIASNVGSIRTLPIEGDLFHRAFMPEEHFMIIYAIHVWMQMFLLTLLIRLFILSVMPITMD